ncbi:MAG TPA: hypothetical protein VKV03_18515 [Candidatus Binataceae bacterium]|nr:hypothetical protein [Candidatus Binataceae bacterium]
MKKFVAGVVVGFVASCAVAFASASASHDGVFWNKLNRNAKDGYVNGYADAMRVSVSKLDTLTTAGDLFHWKGSRKIIHQLETQLSMSELTPQDAVNRLDILYNNQKYSELDLGTALQLLALRPQTNGAGSATSEK